MARTPVPGEGAHRIGERIDHVQVGQGAQNGAPKGGFVAHATTERRLADGGTVTAWAYGVREAPKARLIPGGDFIAQRNAKRPRPVRS